MRAPLGGDDLVGLQQGQHGAGILQRQLLRIDFHARERALVFRSACVCREFKFHPLN